VDTLRRIWQVVSKEFIHLRRDVLLVSFLVLGPVSELVFIAWSTSAPVEHLPTAIVDQDRTDLSRGLVVALENSDTFDAAYYPDAEEEISKLLDAGSVSAGVVIPPGFADRLLSLASLQARVQVILDGSDPTAAQVAERSARGVVDNYGRDQMSRVWGNLGEGLGEVINADVRVWYNEELSEANYTVPSEMGFMLEMVALMIAGISIARERELGTFEQLMATPVRSWELIIGKAIPAVVISYIDFLVMLGITVFVFGVPMKGSLPLLLVLALLYIFVELGWGLLISGVSSSQLQALLLVMVVYMVGMVFSGYAFPVDTMPPVMQMVANLVPIKHWLLVMRDIMLKGAGINIFWKDLLALAMLGVAINSVTLTILRRRLD
jgi:ABC-2 type transport system permease protein